MMKKAKIMLNMAESLALLLGADIDRLDLQKVHIVGMDDFYVLYVDYSNGKHVTIRQDCTIVENEEK